MERPEASANWIVLAILGVLLVIVIVAGVTYEQVGRRRDRERLPQIGRSVDIGGRTLNIYCSGAGRPAVILESGASAGFNWVAIQREIAKFTTACWYDRAGYGWSDLAPYPRTSKDNAGDLHALLGAAGIPPPYLLAATSFGGLDARVYYGLYPREVAGMVLVDSVDDSELEPRARGWPARLLVCHMNPAVFEYPRSVAARFFYRIGIFRLGSPLGNPTPPEPPPKSVTSHEWATIWGLMHEPKNFTARLQEDLDASFVQAHHAGALGDIPLVVLSSARTQPAEYKGNGDRVDPQEQLARLSTRGKHVVLTQGGHAILLNAPEAFIDAVREVVKQF